MQIYMQNTVGGSDLGIRGCIIKKLIRFGMLRLISVLFARKLEQKIIKNYFINGY